MKITKKQIIDIIKEELSGWERVSHTEITPSQYRWLEENLPSFDVSSYDDKFLEIDIGDGHTYYLKKFYKPYRRSSWEGGDMPR